ncbi:uncharacterized protein LOC143371681 [Andrena cerasifolii]|uniref:uncharacterized protein LOC143371681 n=1 Tax=Andrena cerasifolii TaxID=2819439 RepID=UPI0040384DAF
MTEWSNEECLQLISLYEKHPVLWDPKNSFYFSKRKKLDAWDSIANELGMDVQIVRQKMSSLLGSFRQQKSKGNRAMGTGKGAKQVYCSKWFAFERMQFLLDKNQPRRSISTKNSVEDRDLSREADSENEEGTRTESPLHLAGPSTKRKRSECENPYVEKAYSIIANAQPTDDCSTFAENIATKIRGLKRRRQLILMHKINAIVFEAEMEELKEIEGG